MFSGILLDLSQESDRCVRLGVARGLSIYGIVCTPVSYGYARDQNMLRLVFPSAPNALRPIGPRAPVIRLCIGYAPVL